MIGVDTTFLVHLELRELTLHTAAHALLRREAIDTGVPVVLVPQVVAEFIHVVTDPRRFQQPLTMAQALDKAAFWWNASEVRHVFPSSESTAQFYQWMRLYQLGRKRILDTQFAATLFTAGVRRIFTSNRADFEIFPEFELISP